MEQGNNSIFLSEIKDLLRELSDKIQAQSIAITSESFAAEYLDKSDEGVGEMRLPLGAGTFLKIHLGRPPETEVHAAVERSIRALRATARRWEINKIPPCNFQGEDEPANTRNKKHMLKQIEGFLEALVATQNATNAIVVRSGDILCSANQLSERERARLPFVLRQLETAKRKNKGVTSHPSVHAEDVYAARFWYDCSIAVFFQADFSLDFIRHRV